MIRLSTYPSPQRLLPSSNHCLGGALRFSGWRGQSLYDALLNVNSQGQSNPKIAAHLDTQLKKTFMRFLSLPKVDINQHPVALQIFQDLMSQASEQGVQKLHLDQYDPKHASFKFKELLPLQEQRTIRGKSSANQDQFQRTEEKDLLGTESNWPPMSEIGSNDSVWDFFDKPLPFSPAASERSVPQPLSTLDPKSPSSVENQATEKRKAPLDSDDTSSLSSVDSAQFKTPKQMELTLRPAKRARNMSSSRNPFEQAGLMDSNFSRADIVKQLKVLSQRKPKTDYEKQALTQLKNPAVQEFIADNAFNPLSVKELLKRHNSNPEKQSLHVNDIKFATSYCNQKTNIQIGIPATNIHNDRFMEKHRNGSSRPVRELVEEYMKDNPGAWLSLGTIQNKVAEHNRLFPNKRIGPPVGSTGAANAAKREYKTPKHAEYKRFMEFAQSNEAAKYENHNLLYKAYKIKYPKTSVTRYSPYDWAEKDPETGHWKIKEKRER